VIAQCYKRYPKVLFSKTLKKYSGTPSAAAESRHEAPDRSVRQK